MSCCIGDLPLGVSGNDRMELTDRRADIAPSVRGGLLTMLSHETLSFSTTLLLLVDGGASTVAHGVLSPNDARSSNLDTERPLRRLALWDARPGSSLALWDVRPDADKMAVAGNAEGAALSCSARPSVAPLDVAAAIFAMAPARCHLATLFSEAAPLRTKCLTRYFSIGPMPACVLRIISTTVSRGRSGSAPSAVRSVDCTRVIASNARVNGVEEGAGEGPGAGSWAAAFKESTTDAIEGGK